MLKNINGNTVKFERLDEWVIRLTFHTKCHHGDSCILTFDCTHSLLTDELTMLYSSTPIKTNKGARINEDS